MAVNKNSQNVTITLPRVLVEYLDSIARKSDLSRSQVVRTMIRAHQESNTIEGDK